jgi:hypothetical protein
MLTVDIDWRNKVKGLKDQLRQEKLLGNAHVQGKMGPKSQMLMGPKPQWRWDLYHNATIAAGIAAAELPL